MLDKDDVDMVLINKSPKFSLQKIIKAKLILLITALSLNAMPASAFTNSSVVELINSQRTAAGLSTLQQNAKLNVSARNKAVHICENNYWGHTGPDGTTPWTFISNAGYNYIGAAENLARDYYDENTVVNAWMASSTHRDNILNNNYTDVGVGYYLCTCGETSYSIIVTHFGYTSVRDIPAPLPAPESTNTTSTEQVQPTVSKTSHKTSNEKLVTNNQQNTDITKQSNEITEDKTAPNENISSKLQNASALNFHDGYWPHYLLLIDFLSDLQVIELYDIDFNANSILTDLTVV